VTDRELLRDVAARLAAARDEIDPAIAEQILEELELDVAAALEQPQEAGA
jgi:hypothetical protein